MEDKQPAIWTIGHSNRDLETFLDLLNREKIKLIADVRRFPGSRRHPHFGQVQLADSLREHGIDYRHFVNLGGRRSTRLPDSPNQGWEVKAFNAYADYMQSEEFQTALSELMEAAGSRRTAIMCAEAFPWRCHRRLIADALVARGWSVYDIIDERRTTPHSLTKFAKVVGEEVTYPGDLLF